MKRVKWVLILGIVLLLGSCSLGKNTYHANSTTPLPFSFNYPAGWNIEAEVFGSGAYKIKLYGNVDGHINFYSDFYNHAFDVERNDLIHVFDGWDHIDNFTYEDIYLGPYPTLKITFIQNPRIGEPSRPPFYREFYLIDVSEQIIQMNFDIDADKKNSEFTNDFYAMLKSIE